MRLMLDPCSRLLLLLVLGSGLAWSGRSANVERPNLIFILADDLGYGDLGCYGQRQIQTPNLDRLAREGMRLTHHYSGNAVCAPSRCVLMTGLHPGHAWIRDNREAQPEGQAPLPQGTTTLARLLQANGYATGAFGKWGLGPPGSEGDPLRHGFDRFFGYNCQRHAHNHYPAYLWDDDRRVELRNPAFAAHQKLPDGAEPGDAEVYRPYAGPDYAPDRIATQAMEFVRNHRSRPFFLYFPSTIPHLALQVPGDALGAYAGRWDESPYRGERSYLPQRTPRAAYAAMISRLDRHVGDLMRLVEELGLERRTLFVFTSDNGPLYDHVGGTDDTFFNSAGGLRGRKGSLYEGGVRVPGIVRWQGQIKPGTNSERATGFEDWLPTLLELAGLKDAVPAGLDGISFAPTLRGKTQEPRRFLYREFPGYGGQQAVWMGRWKAIRVNLGKAKSVPPLELYDLDADPLESRNLAPEQPAVLESLQALMSEQHRPSTLFPLGVLDAR